MIGASTVSVKQKGKGMIFPGSKLELRRVPLTRIYLGSTHSPQSEKTITWMVNLLNEGYDLYPVNLLSGVGVTDGMYQLEDGRKRFAAHMIVGRPHILAVVEFRQGATAPDYTLTLKTELA